MPSLWGKHTLSRATIPLSIFLLPSEKGSILKGKPLGENAFLLEYNLQLKF